MADLGAVLKRDNLASSLCFAILQSRNKVSKCFNFDIFNFGRNGSAVKIEMPPVERIEQRFPKERWKTLVALVFVFFNFLATTASLSITHELRLAEAGPLPDITLDNIPYQTWALDVSEILIMVATITASLIVVFHKHR